MPRGPRSRGPSSRRSWARDAGTIALSTPRLKYNEKICQFIVHARADELASERPWSVFKIVASTLTLIAIGPRIDHNA
jgi:hypothetical protein